MTAPRYRSGSLRKTKITSPGNNRIVHYNRKKPTIPRCGKTNEKLSGFPILRTGKFQNLSKSQKRISRKYGGTYSAKVVRLALKNAIWERNTN